MNRARRILFAQAVAMAFAMLAAVPTARAQEKELLFEAPAGVPDAQRTKAAKALAARCVAQGMAGVTGDTVAREPNTPKKIRLLAPKGFTEEMVSVAEYLASVPCRTLELRFEHFLSEAEKETYKPGEEAPKGSAWMKFRTWEIVRKPFRHYSTSVEETTVLFRDKPFVDATGKYKIHRHGGGDLFGKNRDAGIFLNFPGAMAKTIYSGIVKHPDPPHGSMLPLNLFIDGAQFPTNNGMMGWRTLTGPDQNVPDLAIWEIPELSTITPIACMLENPLPFALKRPE